MLFNVRYKQKQTSYHTNLQFFLHEEEYSLFSNSCQSCANCESEYSKSPEHMVWHIHGTKSKTELRKQVGGETTYPLKQEVLNMGNQTNSHLGVLQQQLLLLGEMYVIDENFMKFISLFSGVYTLCSYYVI